MSEEFTRNQKMLGSIAAFSVFFLLAAYLFTLILGFLSLKSPADPIGDPYFTILELLIVVIAPLMVLVMVSVHYKSSPGTGMYSLLAVVFMVIMAAITCSVHFVILTVSRSLVADGFPWASQFFSFVWPSVAYALDILAWDLFFALSMLCASVVFSKGRLENATRALMIVSGILSLAGFIGVALSDMNLRNIGIIGYAVVSIGVFFLLGIVFLNSRDDAAGENL
jgi:hypothetical protein